MLHYLADIDADFLAHYGIDLRDPDCDLSGPAFLQRACRLPFYRGVMRERLMAAEREWPASTYAAPAPAAPPSTYGAAPAAAEGERIVSPDEMKALFPDLF